MNNEVSIFYERQAELIELLLDQKHLTFAQDTEQMLQKNLPLAAASYFEHRLCEILKAYIERKTNASPEVMCFFEMKAINRQYHTLFEWEKSNVNKFLSHFGGEFKDEVSKEIIADADLTKAAKDFIELGRVRNNIVHKNYAAFVAEKSSAEVFALFQSAEKFVLFMEGKLLPVMA